MRPSPRTRRVRLVALLALGLVTAGCGGRSVPDGLRVGLEQSRDNENRHLLQVVLTNDGAQPVDVVRLQVRAPGFVDVPPTVREHAVPPGRRIAFPVAYGAADCARSGPAEVVVGHRTADGLQEAALAVPTDDPLLPRLHARECALAELAETAEVAFAPGWQRVGDAARGRLVLRRRGSDTPVTLVSVEGTVVFTLRPGAALPVTLAGRDSEVVVPVTVTASRCDAHALIESKRSYDFPWYTALGDAQPLYGTVRPEGAGQALLEQVLLDTCRATGG